MQYTTSSTELLEWQQKLFFLSNFVFILSEKLLQILSLLILHVLSHKMLSHVLGKAITVILPAAKTAAAGLAFYE